MSNGKHSAESLSAISTFVCVAESTSFTAAAQKMGMSVSGVSKAVSRLEERLQVRLINRTSRCISLTDEGTDYFERCRQILLDLEEAEAAITEGLAKPRGRMRVQFPRALGKKIVMPAITSFLDRYPEISLDMVLDARPLNLEEEGIDVALRYGRPDDTSTLIARRLCCVYYVPCASASYIERFGRPTNPSDLSRFRCINYVTVTAGRYRQWNFPSDDDVVSLSVPSVLNVNDMSALVEAAVTGAGIAYLPDFIVADHCSTGELKIVLPDLIFEGQPIYIVYRRRRYLPPRVRVFLDFLRDLLPTVPKWTQTVLKCAKQETKRRPKRAMDVLSNR
jgi:LysR family transcriptional regulator for bpeEF and oprC